MSIEDTLRFLTENLSKSDIHAFPGAPERTIATFERRLNLQLPDDIRLFYRTYNGFESGEDLFRITPLDEIPTHQDEFYPNHFYLAEYLVYCDMWQVEINPENKNDYTIFNSDKDGEKLILTKSFSEFLNRFLKGGVFDKGGLYDWNDEVKNRSI